MTDRIEYDVTQQVQQYANRQCGACAHWKRPAERTGFRDAVRYHEPYGSERYEEAQTKNDEVDLLFGKCRKINLQAGVDLALDDPIPLAVCKDGSEYVADLYTRAEFGCALWEARS